MTTYDTIFIVNPASKRGSVLVKKLNLPDWIKQHQLSAGVFFTEGPGHGIQLAKQFTETGVKKIIVVGGDGTVSEIVHGIFTAEVTERPSLGVLAAGTGSDFARMIKSQWGLGEGSDWLLHTRSQTIDVGKLVLTDQAGKNPRERYFINIADIGLGAEVARGVNESKKAFGKLSYLVVLIKSFFTYSALKVKITFADQSFSDRLTALVVANGAYFGGGMKIAPEASLNDGQLDLVYIKRLSFWSVLTQAPLEMRQVFKGERMKKIPVLYKKIRQLQVESLEDRPLCLDIDGETDSVHQVQFEIIPQALELLVPASNVILKPAG